MRDNDFTAAAIEARRTATHRPTVNLDTETTDQAHLTTAAITNCGLCDDDGYRGLTVCDHQDHTATARAGISKIREILAHKQLRLEEQS